MAQGKTDETQKILDHLLLKYTSTKSDWMVQGFNKNQIKLETRSIEKDFKNGIMPNLFGMNLMDAVFLLENMGLDVSFEGVGHITNQSIKKGNKISNYKEIKLIAS